MRPTTPEWWAIEGTITLTGERFLLVLTSAREALEYMALAIHAGNPCEAWLLG